MANPKPDEITEKDRRVINGIVENPEMTAKDLCKVLGMTLTAYLGTTRKPAFKLEMDRMTNDLLEVTRFQRTHALIEQSAGSTQAAKLVAELAQEVGRNSRPLESEDSKAIVKTVSQIYMDLQTGAIVSVPDLHSELRTKHPPQDKTDGLPKASEFVLIVEQGKRVGADCANMHIFPPAIAPDGLEHASAASSSINKALEKLTAPCGQGPRKASDDII